MGVLSKFDPDSVFAYNTVQTVEIRDRRLGLMNLLLVAAICVYVVMQLAMNGTYLAVNQVRGSGRFTLDQPVSNCSFDEREAGWPNCTGLCNAGEDGCFDVFPHVDTLAYCDQSPLPNNGRKKRTCRYEDSASASAVFQSSLLVATKGIALSQLKVCSASPADPLYQNGTCDVVYNTTVRDDYYYGAISNYTINVFHHIESPVTRTNTQMVGALHVKHNSAFCAAAEDAMVSFPNGRHTDKAPCYIPPIRGTYGSDQYTLTTLLAAADLSLDDWLFEGSPHTIRDEGTTLVFLVEYSNWDIWEVMFSTKEPRYTYSLTSFANNSFLSQEAIYNTYPGNRTVLQRFGVRFVVVQSGSLREFSFLNLLITLTTSLTLISVTTIIVDLISTKVMTDAHLYRDYKVRTTPDMEHVRKGIICATCGDRLVPLPVAVRGFCPLCESDIDPGSVAYHCSTCRHDRCQDCLGKTIINRKPAVDLQALCLKLYDKEGKGYLYEDELRAVERDCDGVAGDGKSLAAGIAAMDADERSRWTTILLEKNMSEQAKQPQHTIQ
eukprot:gene339-475_t